MDAFNAILSKQSDSELKKLYYELREQLGTNTSKYLNLRETLARKGNVIKSPELLELEKTLDILILQMEAVESIVKLRINP